jgi:hypothetical protein
LIGCDAASLGLEIEDESKKDTAIAAIQRVDGVIKILDFRGRGIQTTLHYTQEFTGRHLYRKPRV